MFLLSGAHASPLPGPAFTEDTLTAENAGEFLTEGDLLVRSNGIREIYGVSGKAIKVGVIGNGVESLALSQSKGELGPVTVLSTGTGDEGTAMLEIIHDIVPDSELVFHSYGGNSSTFKQAVSDLAAYGCNVICDDLYFFRQPFMQDGDVAEHIRQVLNEYPDLLYVTVSGNFALLHYQGDWMPGPEIAPGKTLHDFVPGDAAINITLPAGGSLIATLQWDDPWDQAVSDYDLELVDSLTGEVITRSNFIQGRGADPFEHIAYTGMYPGQAELALRIVRNGDTVSPNTLELFIRNLDPASVADQYVKDPADSIFGHAAIPEVITVGSVVNGDPYQISPDSSRGPVTIRFPEPSIRLKPDICAPTNVRVSGSGNFPTRFPGTSAAAPHVAGVIAMLKSAFPDTTRDDIRQVLSDTASDLGTPGWDETYGYGMINAEKAYQVLYNRVSPIFR